jgi:hypothetical protein
MMNQSTLKQVYQVRKLNEISKKVKKADYLLNENNPSYHARLLLEALDQDEYDKASKVIEKLQGLSDAAEKAGLKSLSDAMDKAVEEINKFTGGGITDRVKSKLASIFSKSAPAENPILKGLAFASSLEKGFGALPTILKNNIKDINNKKGQKISEILTDDKAKKAFSNIIQKAFIPEGTFGKVFGKIPYVADINVVVNEMLESTPEKLASVIKPATSGAKASDINPKIADPKASAGSAKGGGSGEGLLDGIKDKISGAKSFDDLVNVLKKLDQNAEIKNKVTAAKLIQNIEKLKKDPGASGYSGQELVSKFSILGAGGLRDKVKELAKGGGGSKGSGSKNPNAAPSGPEKTTNTKQIQSDAKKVGIDNAKSLATLMNKLNIEVGSSNSAVVIPALKNVMAVDRVDEDQAEGYIMGLMSNFDEFKGKIETAIQKAAEAKAAKEKGTGTPAPAGGTPAA